MDKQLGGGDGVGDVAGSNEAGEVAGEINNHVNADNTIECKICGKWSNNISENKKHLATTHSEYAISIAKEFSISMKEPTKLHKCETCNRNFFFYQIWERHIKKCHNDMEIIGGGGEEHLIQLDSSFETDDENNEGGNGGKKRQF